MNKSLFVKAFRLLIIVFALALPSIAMAQVPSKGITLNMTDVKLESVMDAIEQQSKYLFLNDRVDVDRLVSINVTDAAVEDVLKQLFGGGHRCHMENLRHQHLHFL